MKKILGERIKNARAERKLSRPKLGKLAGGVPPSTIKGIEDGIYDGTLVNFIALSNGLNLPISELMSGITNVDKAPKIGPTKEELLVSLFEKALKLDYDGLISILKLIDGANRNSGLDSVQGKKQRS